MVSFLDLIKKMMEKREAPYAAIPSNLPETPKFKQPKFCKLSASRSENSMQKQGMTWGGAAKSLGREFLGLASKAKAAAPPVLMVAGLGALLNHLYQRMTSPNYDAPWTQYKELRGLVNAMNAQQQEQNSAISNQNYHYDRVYAYLEELAKRQQMAQNRLIQAMMFNNPGGYTFY